MPEFGGLYTGKEAGRLPISTMSKTQRATERAQDSRERIMQQDIALKRQEEADYLEMLNVDTVITASEKANKLNAQRMDQFRKDMGDLYMESKGILNTEDKAKLKGMQQRLMSEQNKSLMNYKRWQEASSIMQQDRGRNYDLIEYGRRSKQYFENDEVPAGGFLDTKPLDLAATFNTSAQLKEWNRQEDVRYDPDTDGYQTTATMKSPWVIDDVSLTEQRKQPWHADVRRQVYNNPDVFKSTVASFSNLDEVEQRRYFDMAEIDNIPGVSEAEQKNAFLERAYDIAEPYYTQEYGERGGWRGRTKGRGSEDESLDTILTSGSFKDDDGTGYQATLSPFASTKAGTQPGIKFMVGRLAKKTHGMWVPVSKFKEMHPNAVIDNGRVWARPVFAGEDGRMEWDVMGEQWVPLPSEEMDIAEMSVGTAQQKNYRQLDDGSWEKLVKNTWNNPAMAMWRELRGNLAVESSYYKGIADVYNRWFGLANEFQYTPPPKEPEPIPEPEPEKEKGWIRRTIDSVIGGESDDGVINIMDL